MKTITPSLQAHLEQEVTTLATCWKIVRKDGAELYFTDHDVALIVDGDLYKADSGYQRTAVANDSSLAVDNLNLEGVFDDDEITEADLRAGKYDYATVFIFIVNWADLAQGILRVRKGRIGEVTMSERGRFRAELRGLTQQLSQNIGKVFQPECRADLGDAKCMIPIDPDLREDSTAYEDGKFLKVQTGSDTTKFLTHADTDATDEGTGNVGTLGANASIQGVETKFGAGAYEFTPSSTNDDTNVVEWPWDDAYDYSTGSFCVEGWVNFNNDGGAIAQNEALISNYETGDRLLIRRATNGNIFATLRKDPSGSLSLFGPTTSTAGTWYHVALTRDVSDDTYRLFFDGVELASEVNVTDLLPSVVNALTLGCRLNVVFNYSLDGFLDEWRMVIGDPVYTANFTPPVAPFDNPLEGQALFENRIYEVTTEGTSAASQPAYNTTPGATTTDGTAVMTARQAWMRNGVIDTVTDGKEFTLTLDFDESRAVDGWFNGGALEFQSGLNIDAIIEIRDWVQSTRTITLFLPMPFTVSPGDLVRLYPGCNKKLSTCRVKFANVINFRGEPHVPGQDQYIKYPDAQ